MPSYGYVDVAIKPSVTIPRLPSAPMNNLVVSNPAEDFLALLRVFITSPEGRTTVYADSWMPEVLHNCVCLPHLRTTRLWLFRTVPHLLRNLFNSRFKSLTYVRTTTASGGYHTADCSARSGIKLIPSQHNPMQLFCW
jgi:hypothetical protein